MGSENIIIRKAKLEDFPEVFRLLSLLWPHQKLDKAGTKEKYTSRIVLSSTLYYCAEWNGKLIGFCATFIMNSFQKDKCYSYLSSIIVEEEWRNRGVGQMLLDAVIEKSKSAGCVKIELETGFHRTEARRFYEKNGFLGEGMKLMKDLRS